MKRGLVLLVVGLGIVTVLAALGATRGDASADPPFRWVLQLRQPPYEVQYIGGPPMFEPAAAHVAWAAPGSETLYANTMNGDWYPPLYPDGLWRSEDAGQTWTNLGRVQAGGYLQVLVVHPVTSTLLFAGYGRPPAPGGVYRSTDGGLNWENVLGDEYIYDIEVDPSQPLRVYAQTGRGVLYRSDDAGIHWNEISNFPLQDIEVHPEQSNVLYGARDLSTNPEEGIYRSEDGGLTWGQLFSWGQTHVIIDPLIPTRLFVFGGGYHGIWRSEDSGQTWIDIQDGLPEPIMDRTIQSAACDPEVPGRIWVALKYAGLFRSEDAGNTWLPANDGMLYVGQGIYGPQCHHISFVGPEQFAIACDTRLYLGLWCDNRIFLPLVLAGAGGQAAPRDQDR